MYNLINSVLMLLAGILFFILSYYAEGRLANIQFTIIGSIWLVGGIIVMSLKDEE